MAMRQRVEAATSFRFLWMGWRNRTSRGKRLQGRGLLVTGTNWQGREQAASEPTAPKSGANFELGEGESVVQSDFAEVVVAAGGAAVARAHVDF